MITSKINIKSALFSGRSTNLEPEVVFVLNGKEYNRCEIVKLSNTELLFTNFTQSSQPMTVKDIYDEWNALSYQNQHKAKAIFECEMPVAHYLNQSVKLANFPHLADKVIFGNYKDLNGIFKKQQRYHTRHYTVELDYLQEYLKGWGNLNLNPEFQRGHVWSLAQHIAFVENLLQNPYSVNRNIHFNDGDVFNGLQANEENSYLANQFVCLDGLQRLTAVLDFMDGKFAIFDNQLTWDMIAKNPKKSSILSESHFDFYVYEFKTNNEAINFYIDFNSAGVAHTQEEIERVKSLIN